MLDTPPQGTPGTHYANNRALYLSDERAREFWTRYCDELPDVLETPVDRRLELNLNLTFDRERVGGMTAEDANALVASIDKYVLRIIDVTHQLLPQHFELSAQEAERIACYLRRDRSRALMMSKRVIRYRGRVLFPYATMTSPQHDAFYESLIYELLRNGDFPSEYLTHHPINSVDTAVANAAPMNDPQQQGLVLKGIYSRLDRDEHSLHDVFDPAHHSAGLPDETIAAKDREHWLPLFFSSSFHPEKMAAKAGAFEEVDEVPIENGVGDQAAKGLERAYKYLQQLDAARANHYWSWIDVGYALHSVDAEHGLDAWKDFTARGGTYTADDCDTHWSTIDPQLCVTVETLEYFASQDSPGEYKAGKKREIQDAINHAIDIQEDIPIAEAFKVCFPFQFLCANYQYGVWYQYAKNRWIPTDGRVTIKKAIIRDFQHELNKMQSDLSSKKAANRDRESNAQCQARIDNLTKLIRHLNKEPVLNRLCDTLKLFYYNGDFATIQDMHPHFMSMPNGVIDTRNNTITIRPGKPQDYVTMTTAISYPFHLHWESGAVREVLDYLHQVFRDQELFAYMMRFFASGLIGENVHKKFPLFLGDGNNSKSMLIRLMEAAYGNYMCKLPGSIYTDKQTAADSATPSIVSARGTRWAVSDEVDETTPFLSAQIKRLTGGDKQFSRDLFQKGTSIKAMRITWTPIVHLNIIPRIADMQGAVWERNQLVPFESTWTHDAPDDEDERRRTGVYKIDDTFSKRIPYLAPAFMWLSVQSFAEYARRGLDPPAKVTRATEEFRVKNNHYIHFTRDCITRVKNNDGTPDHNAQVSLDNLFNRFKAWWTDQAIKERVPTKTDFKHEIETTLKLKANAKSRWHGIRLNSQEDTLDAVLTI